MSASKPKRAKTAKSSIPVIAHFQTFEVVIRGHHSKMSVTTHTNGTVIVTFATKPALSNSQIAQHVAGLLSSLTVIGEVISQANRRGQPLSGETVTFSVKPQEEAHVPGQVH